MRPIPGKNIQLISKAPKELNAFKFEWRKMVLDDNRIPPAEQAILLTYVDRITLPRSVEKWQRTGEIVAWGSQMDLATLKRIGVKVVRRAFRVAEQLGYLSLEQRGNRQIGRSDSWRVMIPRQRKAKREASR